MAGRGGITPATEAGHCPGKVNSCGTLHRAAYPAGLVVTFQLLMLRPTATIIENNLKPFWSYLANVGDKIFSTNMFR